MKKRLILILVLLLLPFGCGTNTGTAQSSADTPYTDFGMPYTYTTTDSLDRRWEEDIVAFANTYLDPDRGHPLLTDRWTSVYYFSDTLMQYVESTWVNYYDSALKSRFLAKINSLIRSIPESTDRELNIGLMEAAAMMQDLHSYVSFLKPDKALPILVVPVDDHGKTIAAIWAIRSELSDLLGLQLLAINDVPIDEIRERMRPMISCENEAAFEAISYQDDFLMNCDVLCHVGVMNDEDETAWITVRGIDGTESRHEVTLFRVSDPDDSTRFTAYGGIGNEYDDTGIYLKDSGDQNVWYRIMKDGEVLYLRFTSCVVDESVGSLFDRAFDAAEKGGALQTVILDFRNNSGGYSDLSGNFRKLVEYLDTIEAKVVILIDGNSFSAAIGIPAMLRRRVEGTRIIGTLGGQPTRFFRGDSFRLPYSCIQCQCSSEYVDFWPNYEDDTLMPDVIVKQTWLDYINGVDSVLWYVLTHKN